MTLTHIAIAAAALVSCLAHAGSYTEEWRVLGPAASQHLGKDGAAITKPATSTTECTEHSPGAPVSITTPAAGPVMAPPVECATVVAPEERGWNERNPALGVQYRRHYESHSDVYLANWVRDSYGTHSFMLAAGRMWPLLEAASLKIDGGIAGGIWYRSVLNTRDDGLVRRVVPVVLPSVSITESYTGLGVNLGFAPKLSIRGHRVNRTPTLMVQTTYLVKESARGWTAFKLGTTERGGINASVSVDY